MSAEQVHRRLATAARVASVLVLAGLLVLGVSRARIDTGIDSFVPRGDTSYRDLERRDAAFGADPIVVLLAGTSRDGLIASSDQLPRLVRLEGQLAGLDDVAVVYGPGTVLNQTATSIRNVLAQISGRRDALENTARAEAKDRGLSGAAADAFVERSIADFDRRYGTLLTQALPMGLPALRNEKFVRSVMFDQAGEPRAEWRFLAPDAKSATLLIRPREGLDQAQTAALISRISAAVGQARREGLETSAPVITGVPAVTAAVSSEARTDAPRVGAVALVAVGMVFLLLPWSRRRRDRLRPMLTALLGTATVVAAFGLLDRPLSLGAVAFLPIVLGIGSDFPLYLSQPSERRRVLVAAGAAAAAFSSLGISSLPFVREFGLALAAGVVATAAWALVLRSRLPEVEPAPATRSRSGAVGRRVLVPLVAIAVLAGGAGFWALGGLRVESSPQTLARGLGALDDATAAERTLGFSGEISLVIRPRDAQGSVLSPAAVDWAQAAESTAVLRHGDELRPLLTMGQLLRFLGADATSDQVTSGASLLPPYLLDAVVAGNGRASSSTFGVRLDDLRAQQRLIDELRTELPPAPAGYEVSIVGLPVVASSGIEAVSASRWLIALGAMLVAAAVVAVGLRDVRLAARAAAASLLATGWVYLILRILDVDLSPLMLAVGALITVTSCEFTVMLDGAQRGRPWLRRSVLVAATAATVGYLCLALSSLAVLSDFGLVLALGVVASLAAAHLVTLRVSDPRPTSFVRRHDEHLLSPAEMESVS